ncbi:signal peptidase II [Pseudoroseicyclus tamaricis]|uniref:Lipoprotein signal peptidase n=1 Tax=Pseudoroseicyclus tamaricis TaxID=2705421 RepID=A0A6B2JM74_9RHOB|nr:signal peptidase II [Pseudoroseicyclus tamaricis]NDV02681.1 signal peptidase II [Pseudoroseicyclus tamaricis]
MRLTLIIAAVVILLDQASKLYIVEGLALKDRLVIDVWPPYLSFHMAWNRGVNFGLFSGLDMRWILIAVALVISALVLSWVWRDPSRRWANVAAGLLVGGALGNVIDRLRYGAVADFLNVSCCGIENPFAFNIADIAVFAGAVGLVLFTGETGRAKADGRKKRDASRRPR